MDEMEGVAKRLRDDRPEASPLELDRIKTTAMSRARSGTRGRVGTRRLAVAGLTAGLLVATTGGVLAGEGGHGSRGGNAANAQYGGECNISNGNGNVGDNNGAGAENNACNENTFITENITNTNTTTITNDNTTNSPVTVVNAAPAASGGVQAAKTTKTPTTSGRHIKIHVRAPHGLKLRRVTVSVNGKHVKTLTGKKASANVELVNLPCSTTATTVKIKVTLSDGKTVISTHQYHLCVA